jgi:serine/threonine-protein phosphatase 2B catalytic subunit
MEALADPFGDRVVTDLPPPPIVAMSDEVLYPNSQSKVPDWKAVQTHLAREGKISKYHFVKLIKDVTDIFKSEPNLIQFAEPLVMVGDIHGQYYDLVHLIEKAGDPATTNYVLMGDYVDRGIYGVE